MTTETRRRLLLACAGAIAACTLATPALAQVAPPPAEAPEQDEQYTPPQEPKKPGMTVRSQRDGEPGRLRERMAERQGQPGAAPTRKRVAPPNIPFRTMVVRDQDNRIVPITRPLALAALANNPTVADNRRDVIMPVVHERHIRQEERILQNLDLYLGFEFGMHDDIDMGNISQLSRLTRQIKPLTEADDIGIDLEDAGVLSPSQRAMNNLIVQDYQKAVSEQLKLEYGREIGPMFRQIIEDALIEPRFAYGLMVLELIKHGPEAINKADMQNAENIADIQEVLVKGWPDDDDIEGQMTQIGDAKAALSRLTLADQEKLLRASRQMREDATIAPLPEIPLSVGGQVGITNPSMGIKVKNYDRDGNVIRDHQVGGGDNDGANPKQNKVDEPQDDSDG